MRWMLISTAFLVAVLLQGQEAVPHYFVRIDHDNKVVGGRYHYDGYRLARPDKVQSLPIDTDTYLRGIADELEALPPDRAGILVYVHGFSAGSKHYERYTAGLLQEEVYGYAASPYGLIVNVVYDTHRNYSKELLRIDDKAKAVADILLSIQDLAGDCPVAVMAHSMGNRLAMEVLNIWSKVCTKVVLDRLVLGAPDLPYDVFEGDERTVVETLVDSAFLYVHDTDRVLGFAASSDNVPRLGLRGLPQGYSTPSNLTVIDASRVKDNETISSSMTNHRYFYTSPSGREDLRQVLGIDSPRLLSRRKATDRPGHFILMTEQQH